MDIARLALRSAIENEQVPTTFISAAKVDFIKVDAANSQCRHLQFSGKVARACLVAQGVCVLHARNALGCMRMWGVRAPASLPSQPS